MKRNEFIIKKPEKQTQRKISHSLLVLFAVFIICGMESEKVHAQEYFPFLQVDVGANNSDAQLQEGFVPFTALDSGTVFNGITIELESNQEDGGKLDSRRRGAPTGDYLEQIWRDFVFARPGGFRLTLSGLEPGKTYQITIFAYDTGSAGQRIADWVNMNTNEVVLTTSFSSADTPSEASHGFSGVTQADENGTIVMEAVANPDHPGDIYAFINALVISTDTPLTKSWLPVPEDGAIINTTTNVELSWNYGQTSVSSDVYVGESFEAVNNATKADTDIFRGNTEVIPFVIGNPDTPYPEGLNPGQTYYWRTDELEEDGTAHKGDVWSFTVASEKAVILYPYDGAIYIDPNVLLAWTPGSSSIEHRVFFGDNLQDVQASTGGTDKGSVTEPNYAPGSLERNTTYYWRIDEYDGTDTHTGDVWSFTTNLENMGTVTMDIWENVVGESELANLLDDPRYPGSPTRTETLTEFGTVDGVGDGYGGQITGWLYCPVSGEYNLLFTSGGGGELWLSTDDDPTNAVLLGTETTWGSYNVFTIKSDPISLVAGEKYYIMARWKDYAGWDHCQVAWQGAGIPNQEIIRGSYLTQYDPVVAYGPNPATGSVDTAANPKFTWLSGKYAASHIIHLGTDPNALEQVGTSLRGDESFIHDSLLLINQTYYWRIDEVNDLNPNSPWIGKNWSFTTANFLIIDDMESYNDIDEGEPGSNRIYIAWEDGITNPANGGSIVGYENAPFAEQTIVHSGLQSMPFAYDNAAGKSEATLTLTSNTDWIVNGVDTLGIWYIGDPANAAETMYVVLNGASVDNPDANAAQVDEWTEWRISLSEFSINLTNVNTITLGFRSITGGTGMMFFDDIRLYALMP
jgi:hypothetical protein